LVAIRQGEALEAWLEGKSNVSQIARNENKLSFQFDGGSEDQAELLKAIVNEDFLISEFAARQETLEDVFMKITTGAVQ
jgi:ABC-2 type transport system ATP-binding protein